MAIFILSIGVAFADNFTDVYVSVEGSDSLGDGSIDNPYQTLNYTIEKSSNNSNIYLKSGVYESTGYEIVNKSLTITGIGDVTVDGMDGKNSQNIFKIDNESSLVLNNIKFVNGKGSLGEAGSLSPITNDGNLTIKNCNFNNFTTINGAVFNKNFATIDNVTESKLKIAWDEIFGEAGNIGFAIWIAEQIETNPSRGEFITNIGECTILNSKFVSTVYNNRNMNITNSYLETFISNRSYDLDIRSIIDKSKIMSLRVSNNKLLIVNNSFVDPRYDILYYTNAIIQNSTFFNDSDKNYYSFRALYSNITVKSSSFNRHVHVEYTNMNITHSTLLGMLSTGYDCYINANYNWWGDNKGPKLYQSSYSTIVANYWIVMTFDYENSTVSVGLTKYTNGNTVWNLKNTDDVNARLVKLDSESGKFKKSQGYIINGSFQTKLINSNVNAMIYATVDNQMLRAIVGKGLTNYAWYVSNDEGNDYFCDGSYENPYKTLSKLYGTLFHRIQNYENQYFPHYREKSQLFL